MLTGNLDLAEAFYYDPIINPLPAYLGWYGRENPQCQWIGLRGNLQESPIFNGKIDGFRLRFSLKPIHWQWPNFSGWWMIATKKLGKVWLLILRCTEGMCFFFFSHGLVPRCRFLSVQVIKLSHKHVITWSILKYLEPFLSLFLSLSLFWGYYEDFFYVLMWKIRALWGLHVTIINNHQSP